jgi:hypothetical protein
LPALNESRWRAVRQHIEFVTCGIAQGPEAAFAAAENAGAQALLVMADLLFSNWRERIAGLVAQYRLPTIYEPMDLYRPEVSSAMAVALPMDFFRWESTPAKF